MKNCQSMRSYPQDHSEGDDEIYEGYVVRCDCRVKLNGVGMMALALLAPFKRSFYQ